MRLDSLKDIIFMVYILKKVIKIGKVKDMTGMVFGRLKVIEYAGENKYNSALWKCECECGKIVIVNGSCLRNGDTKSCGCYSADKTRERQKIHGLSNTRIYSIWHNMLQRCNNKNIPEYRFYGERGIKVCEDWKKSSKFIEWAFVNGYEENLTIDRIDSTKGYYPENCRWITEEEQHRNTTRNKHVYYRGKKICIAEAARILNFDRSYACKLNKKGELQEILNKLE